MFENFNKVGSIEVLEQKLKQLKTQPNNTSYWQKLSDECSKMSADQLNYLNTCEEVTQAKNQMMEAFNLYLFEKFKDDFSEQEIFRKICDDYQDTILDIAKKYSESIAKTLDENKELKAKIQELERKLSNAKSNTKGA
jgi:cell division septum initiation protein DivIVA